MSTSIGLKHHSIPAYICLWFCSVVSVEAATAKQTIGELLKRYQLAESSVSLEVTTAASDQAKKRPILEWNRDLPLNPASTLKLLTATAALYELGPSYRFRTEFYIDGRLDRGVLDGSLYVKGYGDPGTVSETLWRMAMDLRNRGIYQVKGDLVGDASFLPARPLHGDFSKDMASNSSGGALSVNYNHLQVWVQPTTVGQAAKIVVDPPVGDFARVDNRTKTTSGNKRRLKVEVEATDERDRAQMLVRVSGSIGVSAKAYQQYRPVFHPGRYFLAAFREQLERAGVPVLGGTRVATVPSKARLFFSKQSEVFLSQLLILLNHYSNNFIAEQLVMALGSKEKPLSKNQIFTRGVRAIEGLLPLSGVNASGAVIRNGSGLSRQNRLSARQLSSVLRFAYKNPSIRANLVSSLEVFNEVDNERQRLAAEGLNGTVRAKTGSLNDVVGLAGFVFADNLTKPTLVFTILVNQKGISRLRMSRFQNDVLKLALERL